MKVKDLFKNLAITALIAIAIFLPWKSTLSASANQEVPYDIKDGCGDNLNEEALRLKSKGMELLYIEGKSAQAIQLLERSIEIEPRLSSSYIALGLFYLSIRHDSERAIALLRDGIMHCPREPVLFLALAMAYADGEDHERALVHYRKSMELGLPTSASFFYNFANSYESLGEYDLAIDGYKSALKLNPKHMNALYNLVMAYYTICDKDNVTVYAQEIQKIINPLDNGAMWVWAQFMINKKCRSLDIPSDTPIAVRNLIEGLYAPDPQRQTESIRSLEKMGSKAIPAIPFLIDIMEENNPTVILDSKGEPNLVTTAYFVAAALEAIGEAAIDPLISVLDSKDPQVRDIAATALGKITGEEFGDNAAKWRSWRKSKIRK